MLIPDFYDDYELSVIKKYLKLSDPDFSVDTIDELSKHLDNERVKIKFEYGDGKRINKRKKMEKQILIAEIKALEQISKNIEYTMKLERLGKYQKGKGIKKYNESPRNSYKINSKGSYASTNPLIDPSELLENYRIKAYLGGSLVYDDQGDRSLVDLLTKRFNCKKPYSYTAIQIFNDLNLLNNVKPHRSSKKSKLGCNINFTSVDQMIKRLKLLTASRNSGNNSITI